MKKKKVEGNQTEIAQQTTKQSSNKGEKRERDRCGTRNVERSTNRSRF